MLSLCGDSYHEWSGGNPDSTILTLAASFGSLGTGSAFFHGSQTTLGNRIDNAPIAHIALTAYQSAVSSLPTNWVVANCLPAINETVNNGIINGTAAVSLFNHIFADNDVDLWDALILESEEHFRREYQLVSPATRPTPNGISFSNTPPFTRLLAVFSRCSVS